LSTGYGVICDIDVRILRDDHPALFLQAMARLSHKNVTVYFPVGLIVGSETSKPDMIVTG